MARPSDEGIKRLREAGRAKFAAMTPEERAAIAARARAARKRPGGLKLDRYAEHHFVDQDWDEEGR
jgi:hypothetical protein